MYSALSVGPTTREHLPGPLSDHFFYTNFVKMERDACSEMQHTAAVSNVY